ncbi:MAG TPA: DUF1569 domain-containing protein [Gemmatimonadaceae bacterium]|jgi:hypothetical protein|nr:DUF1569 domain-containing protein [Gemmatimonadaceae bacterium]
MPKTLWNVESRRELLDRLGRVKPDAAPLWGRMNAGQMMAHLVGWMKMANGELKTAPLNRPLRYAPLKQMIIYWLPWPKGVPTAPELLAKEQCDFAGEQAAFRRYMEAYERTPDRTVVWPEHPAFGNLTTNEWGVLGYRHTDHHLRQFGV